MISAVPMSEPMRILAVIGLFATWIGFLTGVLGLAAFALKNIMSKN